MYAFSRIFRKYYFKWRDFTNYDWRKFTHAVKKIAKKGDFRVQDDHGGKVEKYHPTKEEITFAENCIKACHFATIYARVDIVYDNNNKPSLSELELTEPELWFRNYPKAAELLAEEIEKLFC
jgi:glutathione synthase/RimK-type ligase-like ATP-grasp enzyme